MAHLREDDGALAALAGLLCRHGVWYEERALQLVDAGGPLQGRVVGSMAAAAGAAVDGAPRVALDGASGDSLVSHVQQWSCPGTQSLQLESEHGTSDLQGWADLG